MKIYAVYACILAILLSVANDFINFCSSKGGRSNLKENKAIYAALFPRPALNLVWKTFFLLSLSSHLMTMVETYYLLI